MNEMSVDDESKDDFSEWAINGKSVKSTEASSVLTRKAKQKNEEDKKITPFSKVRTKK